MEIKSNLHGYFIYLLIILLCYSCSYWKKYNHDYSQSDSDKIKNIIAHFEDFSLNNNDINLSKYGNYYIGHAKYQKDAYFLGYIDNYKNAKVCRIFSNKWSYDKALNELIIKVNDSLNTVGLNIDTIYGEQENDSIGVVLLDLRKGITNSIWDLKSISYLNYFDSYTLVKCSAGNCPESLSDFFNK